MRLVELGFDCSLQVSSTSLLFAQDVAYLEGFYLDRFHQY